MKSKPYKLLILFIILISNSLIYGCTNKNAYNYNPRANRDDGTCILIE